MNDLPKPRQLAPSAVIARRFCRRNHALISSSSLAASANEASLVTRTADRRGRISGAGRQSASGGVVTKGQLGRVFGLHSKRVRRALHG